MSSRLGVPIAAKSSMTQHTVPGQIGVTSICAWAARAHASWPQPSRARASNGLAEPETHEIAIHSTAPPTRTSAESIVAAGASNHSPIIVGTITINAITRKSSRVSTLETPSGSSVAPPESNRFPAKYTSPSHSVAHARPAIPSVAAQSKTTLCGLVTSSGEIGGLAIR